MSLPDTRIAALEAEIARGRAAFSGSVSEIARRLRPASLVDTAFEKISGKAVNIAGEAVDMAKQHGGQATLFGAGALLAFDIGRRTSKTPTTQAEAGLAAAGAEDSGPIAASAASRANIFGAVANMPTALTVWGGALAAAAAGYSLGKVVPRLDGEEQLLAGVSRDLKDGAQAFWQEHAEGARQTGAQAFGIAGLAAAALGVMAAVGQLLSAGSKSGAAAEKPLE